MGIVLAFCTIPWFQGVMVLPAVQTKRHSYYSLARFPPSFCFGELDDRPRGNSLEVSPGTSFSWVLSCWLFSRIKGLSRKPCLRHLSGKQLPAFLSSWGGPPSSVPRLGPQGVRDGRLVSGGLPLGWKPAGQLAGDPVRRSLLRCHDRSVGS